MRMKAFVNFQLDATIIATRRDDYRVQKAQTRRACSGGLVD